MTTPLHGLRVLGQMPDEVEVEITVRGRRVADVYGAFVASEGSWSGQQAPIMLGIAGLTDIRLGTLVGVNVDSDALEGEEVIKVTMYCSPQVPEQRSEPEIDLEARRR